MTSSKYIHHKRIEINSTWLHNIHLFLKANEKYILFTQATNFKLSKKGNSVNVITLSNQRIEVFPFTQHQIHTIQTQHNHSQTKQTHDRVSVDPYS